MTPNDAPSTIPGNPDSILELMQLPAFQNLLAKVETNFYRNRPKEAAELELEGTIRFTLQERAAQAWEILEGSPLDGPSDGPGAGVDLRTGLPAAGVGRQLILEGDAKATQLDFGTGSRIFKTGCPNSKRPVKLSNRMNAATTKASSSVSRFVSTGLNSPNSRTPTNTCER